MSKWHFFTNNFSLHVPLKSDLIFNLCWNIYSSPWNVEGKNETLPVYIYIKYPNEKFDKNDFLDTSKEKLLEYSHAWISFFIWKDVSKESFL